MTGRRRFLILAAFVLTAPCCRKAVDGEDVLFRVDGEAVTVSEAGTYWDSLAPGVRLGFTSDNNPVGDFILAYTRRILVEHEIERLGILGNPAIGYRSEAWTRLRASRIVEAAFQRLSAERLSELDDSFYLEHLGITVWYTATAPGSTEAVSYGPTVLSVMDPAEGLVLAALEEGHTAAGPEGVLLTLDSLEEADPELVAVMMSDSSGTLGEGRDMMALHRAQAAMDSLAASFLETSAPVVSRSAIAGFASIVVSAGSPSTADTLIVSGAGAWTADRMVEEIRVQAETGQVIPSDTSWLASFCGILLRREALASCLEDVDPGACAQLDAESRSYRMRLAADTLYRMFVSDSISVTQTMLDSAFAVTSPIVPERRVAVCIVLHDSAELVAFRNLAVGPPPEDHGWFRRFGGLESVASRDDPLITRPLGREEIPAGLGGRIFAAGDTTTWFGPEPHPGMGVWIAARLDSVIPARPATFEEAAEELRSAITAAGEQARFEEWMRELEQAYGLEIDEEVMDLLPPDPSDWSEL